MNIDVDGLEGKCATINGTGYAILPTTAQDQTFVFTGNPVYSPNEVYWNYNPNSAACGAATCAKDYAIMSIILGFTPLGLATDIPDMVIAGYEGNAGGIILAGVAFIPGGDLVKVRKLKNADEVVASTDEVVDVANGTTKVDAPVNTNTSDGSIW